ncbi:MAG: hypothetical protein GF317_04645 [Candidatus Lokiarchaeota archaeon]|nr:hypothetical protein [Candidatus Lokiarchaeota archaeon]
MCQKEKEEKARAVEVSKPFSLFNKEKRRKNNNLFSAMSTSFDSGITNHVFSDYRGNSLTISVAERSDDVMIIVFNRACDGKTTSAVTITLFELISVLKDYKNNVEEHKNDVCCNGEV